MPLQQFYQTLRKGPDARNSEFSIRLKSVNCLTNYSVESINQSINQDKIKRRLAREEPLVSVNYSLQMAPKEQKKI